MGAAEAADDATRALQAYVEAIVRDDFEIACSYLCKAGRALALVQAKVDGLDTDDCAAALAYVMQRHTGDQPRPADAVTALIESVTRVEMIDADHAIVRLVPGWFAHWDTAHADEATRATTRVPDGDGDGDELPLVREDGGWKIGVSVGSGGGRSPAAPQRREASRREYVPGRRRWRKR
jgi:hypothetical protein